MCYYVLARTRKRKKCSYKHPERMMLVPKKKQDLFSSYLDEVYDVTNVLKQEGKSHAECRYMEIMAVLLLFVLDSLRVIRSCFFAAFGIALGLFLSNLL